MANQIVSDPEKRQEALRHIRPNRVAVAFVGNNWKDYIVNPHDLTSIVISPTIGSNPKAIDEISKEIGWDNVHFLDNLHSKIYIGHDQALIGSCNLSDNGMGEGGLEEVAIILHDKHHLIQLNTLIDGYIEMAKRMYPTEESKKLRLKELIQQRNEMPRYCPPGEYGKQAVDLASYTYQSSHRIHIVWYINGKFSLNEGVIRSESEMPLPQSIEDYYSEYMQFCDKDQIKVDDWLLCWKCNNDSRPSGSVSWMYVDEVIENGCSDSDYPKLVGQLKKSIPTPPFSLTKKSKELICEALVTDDFKDFRPHENGDLWSVNSVDGLVPHFFEYLQKKINKANSAS